MKASEFSMEAKADFVKTSTKTMIQKGATRLCTSSGIKIINEL